MGRARGNQLKDLRVFRDMEIRADEENREISGYIALFDSPSVDMGFTEYIAPGAFSKSLRESPSIKALKNHDSNWILGNTASGTLRLREDERGLFAEIDPPATTWANDLIESIKRGDVSGSSFGFAPVKKESRKADNGSIEQTLTEVRLHEVSVGVVFPAYPEAETIQARALEELSRLGFDFNPIVEVLEASKQDGYEPTKEHEEVIRGAIGDLEKIIIRKEPVPTVVDHSIQETPCDFLESFRNRLDRLGKHYEQQN